MPLSTTSSQAAVSTLAQNASTTARVQDLIWEDPENLLEEDRWLLTEDFSVLGKSSEIAKECWVADMEAAKSAALTRQQQDETPTPNQAEGHGEAMPVGVPYPDPPVNSEGSIKIIREHIK